MRLAVTGFVSGQAGSVASANALLLRALLDQGCEVQFFSKASFVDPRPTIGDHAKFKFTDVDNSLADRTRAGLARVPVVGKLAGILDATTYNRLLVRRINEAHARQKFDLCLWLGDYACGSVPGIPTVSFAQGPPGTDARSIIGRREEITHLAGPALAAKLRLMARYRLSRFGLPNFPRSDHFIIGSTQSRETLRHIYGIDEKSIHILPYPIDLTMFTPSSKAPTAPALRCLWLGRIIPRKRLDLFLNAATQCIQQGIDLNVTIIGDVGFVPGYERLIEKFSHPARLHWERFLPRENVPFILQAHDILAQPSEEENFGSSVAEAQACGLPVIVGATNGNKNYLCSRDIALTDYRVETLAAAFSEMAARKSENSMGDPSESRNCAERNFSIGTVSSRLMEILDFVVSRPR